MTKTVIECPSCRCQIEIAASFASGPKREQEEPSGETTGDIGEILESIDKDSLNPWEAEFIKSLSERFEQYGSRIKMSDKQMVTLLKIAGKRF